MKKNMETAISAAIAAGRMIKKSLGKAGKIRYKSDINIVTAVDIRAERMIISRLKRHFPDYGILAEEKTHIEEQRPIRWIIDPLDGTTNFARGFPFFAVSIALEVKKEIVLGVVYDPLREELFTAERGKGAYLNRKRKISVSKTSRVEQSFLATGFSYSFKKKRENNIRHFKNFLMSALALRRAGAATLDLCYVACGRFDGFWELDLCPWDTAAGFLIAREAGGKVTHFNGTKFSPYTGNIVASNGRLHAQMIKILNR
ncbi:MAG: inositol monophosphatase [Candidatus Omnitrophica bacterium]|nr:inositol monophosphatase [Candidatus Omnitrophota bacterium]